MNGNGELRLVYIIGTYPVLTTTFIDREIRLLREWCASLRIISIRRPRGMLSPEQKAFQRDVVYLLPVSPLRFLSGHLTALALKPRVYLGTLAYLLTRPGIALRHRIRTLLHFGLGVYAAHLLRGVPLNQLHAHFIDRAATVALVAGRLLGVPYSVTAHANDIYVAPLLLREKLAEARSVITCTRYNEAELARVGGDLLGDKLCCIYHGLDIEGYHPISRQPQGRPVVLSVGQLKPKKGFTTLLQACRILKERGCEMECRIIGDGPLRETLEAQVRDLDLTDMVALCGPLPHQEVVSHYQDATIFVLASVVSADGDRDGIPNVILEALAMELPVVATELSGIPEVIQDGITGWLVAPGDAAGLAEALEALLEDPQKRQQFARAGRRMVTAQFDAVQNVRRLYHQFTEGEAG
jgi:glycosyltransferase involved in cell wall biosynthesis